MRVSAWWCWVQVWTSPRPVNSRLFLVVDIEPADRARPPNQRTTVTGHFA
jgi:hypothetical protein